MATPSPNLDVLVIGAGQAGLALGFHLRRRPFRFQIVDRNSRVGDSWRKRFDSLVLFTPRAYSALPGLEVPGDPDAFPTKDEMADYLETYADHFDLPVVTGTGIRRLGRMDGGFRVTTDSGQQIDSRAVVLATGAFQRPAPPAISKQLSEGVLQLSPENYKAPSQLQPGRVLVAGDGATGREIASELSTTHEILLATGRPRRVSPERILGRSVFWWMDKLGILRASRESAIGRYLMKADPFPGKALELSRLREQGVVVVGRIVRAEGTKVAFAGGETTEVDAVVWATGYRDDSDWVEIPEVKDERGRFIHQRGISPVPRLYFIGRSWQWTRGSALLVGVGADASYLTEHIVKHLDESAVA
ncbi:MAG TPA: NAD(P)/FAD-dependent oxidoreductase [Rubrobacter sp.]|nr:NAD(P)/FAD-dependent oxidoreductase [Rubrobacter sp.]